MPCMCAQSCLTLCDPMESSPPGSSVHGILQARILECIAIFFFKGPSRPRNQTHIRGVSYVSCIGRQVLYAVPPGKPDLIWRYLQKLFLQIKSPSQVPEVRIWIYYFRPSFNPLYSSKFEFYLNIDFHNVIHSRSENTRII